MIEIMESIQKYVPFTIDKSITLDGVPKTDILETCLFGGDQLTCARARSAKPSGFGHSFGEIGWVGACG